MQFSRQRKRRLQGMTMANAAELGIVDIGRLKEQVMKNVLERKFQAEKPNEKWEWILRNIELESYGCTYLLL